MAVKAPRAGTVVYPTDWRGEKKKVGDSVWRMQAAVQIVGLSKMVGNGEIDEIDVARVAVGQPVSIKLDAMPDEKARGVLLSTDGPAANVLKLKPPLVLSEADVDRAVSVIDEGLAAAGR